MNPQTSGPRPPSRWKLFLALGLLFLLLSCGSVTSVGIWLFFRLRPLFAAAESRPTLCITTRYAGASAQVVENTIAVPLEVQLSGMEGLDVMESICGDDGTIRLTLYLRPGTDLGVAKVLAQNRVALASPLLPDVVKQRGLAITSGVSRPPRLRAPVVLSITGPSLEEATRLADAIHERLGASDAASEVCPAYPRSRSLALVVIDRERAKMLGVPMKNVRDTLLVFDGELKPDDFRADEEPIARLKPPAADKEILKLLVANDEGRMVRLGELATIREMTGPEFIQRINGQRRLLITARPASGVGIEDARRRCREIAEQVLRERNLPNGYQIECTGSDTVERE